MSHQGKKLQDAYKKIDKIKLYPIDEAIKLAKESSYSKFDGTMDLAIKLNLDVRKTEQQLRGSVALPHGSGKKVKILVATDKPEAIEEAKKAKADIIVGKEDLIDILQKEKFNFDIMIADPAMMPTLGKYGKVLGPKGLMPNPKLGTVTANPAKLIEELKKGKANYRTDKNGIVHVPFGKVSFKEEHLVENANTVVNLIRSLRPSQVKGAYFQTMSVSASMGPSVKVKIEL